MSTSRDKNSSLLKMADDALDVLDRVSFLNKYPLLAKSTSDSDQPTSGHVHNEINKITFESGVQCLNTLDYLLNRLDKKSPFVKLKALKVIHHLVLHGHVEFRHALRKKDSSVKDATSCSGPTNTTEVNAIYVSIRKEAAAILQHLYNADVMNDDLQIDNMKLLKKRDTRLGGMGSCMKSGKYLGFGNSPSVINKSMAERVVGNLVGIVDKFLRYPTDDDATSLNSDPGNYKAVKLCLNYENVLPDTPPPPSSSTLATVSSHTGVAAVSAAVTAVAVPVIASRHRHHKVSQGHRPGVAGGGWDDTAEVENVAHSNRSQTNTPENELMQSNSVSTDSLERDGSSSDCKTEECLVNEIIESSSSCKSFHFLNQFINKWSNVNWAKVLELLDDQLRTDTKGFQMKILLLLEVLIYQDIVSVDIINEILLSTLSQLKESSLTMIQDKVNKLLLILERKSNAKDSGSNSSNPNICISATVLEPVTS